MEKEQEDYLWNEMDRAEFPRDIIQQMIHRNIIKSKKQAWATLEKWIKQGKYEYGCCLDLGWKIKKQKI